MFPGGFFAKTFFAGTYFAPADGGSIITSDNIHLVGMLTNFGFSMNKR